jgi:hypothetical protein
LSWDYTREEFEEEMRARDVDWMIRWSWSIIERLMVERDEARTQIRVASREIDPTARYEQGEHMSESVLRTLVKEEVERLNNNKGD